MNSLEVKYFLYPIDFAYTFILKFHRNRLYF